MPASGGYLLGNSGQPVEPALRSSYLQGWIKRVQSAQVLLISLMPGYV